MLHQIWKISLLVLAVSFLHESSASMHCYTCVSPLSNDCRDITQMQTLDCAAQPSGHSSNLDPVCMKIVKIESNTGHYTIIKTCGWEGSSIDACSGYDSKNFPHCSSCNSKLCNGASKAIVSVLTLVLMVLISKIIN